MADEEVFLKKLPLGGSNVPVDSPIETEAAPAASEIELPFANSVSDFEAAERHGGGDERLEFFRWVTRRLDPLMVLLDNAVQIVVCANAHVAPFTCSLRNFHSADRVGTWPSSGSARGNRSAFEASALRMKTCASTLPRSRRSRKSIVFPFWSTALYK